MEISQQCCSAFTSGVEFHYEHANKYLVLYTFLYYVYVQYIFTVFISTIYLLLILEPWIQIVFVISFKKRLDFSSAKSCTGNIYFKHACFNKLLHINLCTWAKTTRTIYFKWLKWDSGFGKGIFALQIKKFLVINHGQWRMKSWTQIFAPKS